MCFFQTSLAKPVEDSSNLLDDDLTPKQNLLIYAGTNFLVLGIKYIDISIIASKEILKDQDLIANNKPEILEFKKKLNTFVKSIEDDKDAEKFLNVFEIFGKTIDYYLELSKEKETPETQFIVDILKKYKIKDIEGEFNKDFDNFLEEFKVLFEAAKKDMDKSLLEWYEKFAAIEDVEKKIESLEYFLSLFNEKEK